MTTLPQSPPSHHPDDVRVERVSADRLEEAIGALLGAGPAACERFARQAAQARVRLDLGWAIVDPAGRYRMAVFAIPSPGRAVMLLATHPRDLSESQRFGKAIEQAALGSRDLADIAQALVDPTHLYDAAAFHAGGLKPIATLDYLERALPRAGVLAPSTPPQGWTIEPAATPEVLGHEDPSRLSAERAAEIAGVLEASYIATQDCPGLAGLRKTSDVLTGHFGTGARPRFWLLARERHDPNAVARGVALVNVSHDGAAAELVYLGLAPDARGKGIARALMLQALSLASTARCTSMQLAVDAKNHAARKLYDELGFRKTTSRLALVRGLRA